jgi:P27 family predicted phage terminase small subunit
MARPTPKPTALRMLQGRRTGHAKPINKQEPKPQVGIPEMPAHLSAAAKRHWKHLSPTLAGMGCLTQADDVAFGALCEAYEAYIVAKRNRLKGGFVITSPNGYQVQSAYVGMERQALKQLMSIAAEFGMTPSSRSRIKAGEPVEAADPFEDLLKSA